MARRPRSCCIRRGPSDSLTQRRMRSSAVSVFSPRKGASVTSDGKAIKWQPLQLEDLLRHGNRSRAGNVCKVHSLAQSRLLQGADPEQQGDVAESSQGKVINRTPLTPLQCLISISSGSTGHQLRRAVSRAQQAGLLRRENHFSHCRVRVSVLAVASHRSLTRSNPLQCPLLRSKRHTHMTLRGPMRLS